MKDFAKSIVCNTKAEADKVGNSYQYAGSIPIEKIPDNWRPEFPKAGYIVYYAPNKAKWFATEAEAKRFAESQDKAQKTGNTRTGNINYSGIKEFKSESELRRWCMDHNYTYTPTHGGYYRLEDDKPGSYRPNLEAHVRQGQETGNKKVGNATIVDLMGQAKEYNTKFWEAFRKADQKEAEKWSGYAKILKRQIAEERSDIQQRLKKLDEAEKMISFSY